MAMDGDGHEVCTIGTTAMLSVFPFGLTRVMVMGSSLMACFGLLLLGAARALAWNQSKAAFCRVKSSLKFVEKSEATFQAHEETVWLFKSVHTQIVVTGEW
uniref:Uncharacterized protein n=1 Tax=Oryza sativa subsp. japonica TaxID=39947 RepID=Q6ZG97_ORYSJ|nr:hypothetical protein [Oryza sativa Japonica Group]